MSSKKGLTAAVLAVALAVPALPATAAPALPEAGFVDLLLARLPALSLLAETGEAVVSAFSSKSGSTIDPNGQKSGSTIDPNGQAAEPRSQDRSAARESDVPMR